MPQPGPPLPAGGADAGGGPMGMGLPWVTSVPQYNKLLAYMETMYSTAQVCMNEGPCLPLQRGEYPSLPPA